MRLMPLLSTFVFFLGTLAALESQMPERLVRDLASLGELLSDQRTEAEPNPAPNEKIEEGGRAPAVSRRSGHDAPNYTVTRLASRDRQLHLLSPIPESFRLAVSHQSSPFFRMNSPLLI